MPTSPDTLLRLLHQVSLPIFCTPRVLGVDDWAFHRGTAYGTILCDLERHRAIELLPDRSSQTLANWLKSHSGVEVVSRDRGDFYIKGASEGAPEAVQVADRWHLLRNLREALVRLLERHTTQIRQAARDTSAKTTTSSSSAKDSLIRTVSSPDANTAAKAKLTPSRNRRFDRYRRVKELAAQGVSIREIARRLGIHRRTVRKFNNADTFPERASRKYHHATEAFEPYLRQRWDEGERNARQLTCELHKQGFAGSYYMVRRSVARWRSPGVHDPSEGADAGATDQPHLATSANQLAWLIIRPFDKLTSEQGCWLTYLADRFPSVSAAIEVAHQFTESLRQRSLGKFEAWLAATQHADVPPGLHRFGRGLEDDLAAVKAALTLPWSNGQTEGQINRLKTIKRQMFGRGSLELLRTRFLCPI